MQSCSLISEKIAKFYLKNLENSGEDGAEYFNKDMSINFQKIHELLLENAIQISFQELSYDDFLNCYNALNPVFRRSVSIINEAQIETLNLKWLGSNTKYLLESVKSISIEAVSTGNVEIVLLLSAMLEHALGSVYYILSEQRTPPHLLRDLLATNELLKFFGVEAITFLRILLGTPDSINLRNIVWHGFPRPEDIPTYYVTILLLIVHTLGNILEEKHLVLVYRTQVDDFKQYVEEILSDLPVNISFKPTEMHLVLENCQLLDQKHKDFWTRLFYLLSAKKYWNFITLILPQIELILRIKYGQINDFDVSAKLDEYYIIMDTIFEPIVPNNSANKLISSEFGLSEGILKLLYDLFVAPCGSRLRDKVSHGEVDLEAIKSRQLCHILLYLSLHLLSDDHERFPLNSYESKFHLNCRTKKALDETNAALKSLAKVQLAKTELTDYLEIASTVRNIKIFGRPKKESVYMFLIYKTSNLITKTCKNYEESITFCQTLLAQHELRSRRRRTLTSLLDSLPKIYNCLSSIFDCLLEIFLKLQGISFEGDIGNADQVLRFLKHSLKITENFVRYSHVESNEWIKAIELCNSFLKLREKLFSAAS